MTIMIFVFAVLTPSRFFKNKTEIGTPELNNIHTVYLGPRRIATRVLGQWSAAARRSRAAVSLSDVAVPSPGGAGPEAQARSAPLQKHAGARAAVPSRIVSPAACRARRRSNSLAKTFSLMAAKDSVCDETPACWKSKQRGGVACKRHISHHALAHRDVVPTLKTAAGREAGLRRPWAHFVVEAPTSITKRLAAEPPCGPGFQRRPKLGVCSRPRPGDPSSRSGAGSSTGKPNLRSGTGRSSAAK